MNRIYAAFAGILILFLGCITLLGNILGRNLVYSWGGASGTSIPTAVMAILTGIAILLLATDRSD